MKDRSFEKKSAEHAPQPPPPSLKYVGPDYVGGIGHSSLWLGEIRPRDWSDEQIKDFLDRHPEFSDWFELV